MTKQFWISLVTGPPQRQSPLQWATRHNCMESFSWETSSFSGWHQTSALSFFQREVRMEIPILGAMPQQCGGSCQDGYTTSQWRQWNHCWYSSHLRWISREIKQVRKLISNVLLYHSIYIIWWQNNTGMRQIPYYQMLGIIQEDVSVVQEYSAS